MGDFAPLYRHSFSEAERQGQLDAWSASHKENLRCRQFIDRAIDENYHDNRLGGDGAGDAIREFGFDRTNWVLANTIQRMDWDGRFSAANKAWAKEFFIPKGEGGWDLPADLPRANLWCAGFPCTDVSNANQRQLGLDGARSGLFFEVIRLLDGLEPEARPEWCVFENVVALLSVRQGWPRWQSSAGPQRAAAARKPNLRR